MREVDTKTPMTQKILGLLLLAFVGFGIYLSRTNLQAFETWYVVNDGLIEWLTVIGFITGAVICFYRSRILAPFRDRLFLTFLIIEGFIYLAGAVIELSWRLKWLNLDWFSVGEITLPHLLVNETTGNKFVLTLFALFYLVVLPLLYHLKTGFQSNFQRLINRFAIALPQIGHTMLFLFLIGILFMVEGQKKGELLVMGGVWVFVMLTLYPFNREVFSRTLLER